MSTNVIMPQLGESVVEGTVSRWLKQEGESINEFEPICEVTTDKVDTEIPAPASGVVIQILVPEGETVSKGTLLAVIGQPGEHPNGGVPEKNKWSEHEPSPVLAPSEDEGATARRYSPVVVNMAAEHQIDLSLIKGTGLNGRVTKKDVELYLNQRKLGVGTSPAAPTTLPPWEMPGGGDLFKPTDEIFKAASAAAAPASQPSKTQPQSMAPSVPSSAPKTTTSTPIPSDMPGELIPHSAMRRSIAAHMVTSKLHTAPHVTTVFEIDMARVMSHWKANEGPYKAQGIRLTLTAYFVLAMVKAAQAQPILNSQWTEEGLFMPKVIHVGMAVALQEGLIVPVIKNAQDLNLSGLARQVTDLAVRARAKQLKADETRGGTITLTNHGVSGSLFATPIINQPQSAILGVGAVQKRAVVIESEAGDSIAIRPMMYATLTFDHRVADGALGDAFMVVFKKSLEQFGA